ncbi:hypothetical protein [Paracoccus sp. S3-43]|nr:hypothetical protein [Paracoccus sp. S3-43]WEF24140.1 hypothetical protein PXD02_15365 [Paracoccus sp. S3-43]
MRLYSMPSSGNSDKVRAGTKGGFDMARFAAVNRWLDRVAALPGYAGLDG